MTAATLEEVLAAVSVEHQRIPMFDGGLGQRCVGCDSLRGESDGPNSPRHAEHVAVEQAAAVRAWLADRLADEGLREAVARALAQMEPGEDEHDTRVCAWCQATPTPCRFGYEEHDGARYCFEHGGFLEAGVRSRRCDRAVVIPPAKGADDA